MSSEPSSGRSRRKIRVGKYEVVRHIATGGMGVVYLARDTDLQRDVALKILSPELAAQPAALQRFQREAPCGPTQARKHRGHLRVRFRQWKVVSGTGIRRWNRFAQIHPSQGTPGSQGSAGHHHPGGPGSRPCPRPGHRPSRRQTVELYDPAGGRPAAGEVERFWPGARARRRGEPGDPRWHHRGHHRLHGPRAGLG